MGGGDVGANLQCCYRDNVAYNLYTKFCVPKLFLYAVNGRWDKIPVRCISHKREAAFVHKYPPADTALHRIVRPAAGEITVRNESDPETLRRLDTIKLNAIQALLQATEYKIACIQDSFGRTPLHLACMDIYMEEIALQILQSNPYAASIRDSEQRTPLHLLCARNEVIPLNLLQQLLQQYPSALLLEDVTGDTPTDIIRVRLNEITNSNEVLSILTYQQQSLQQLSRGDSDRSLDIQTDEEAINQQQQRQALKSD
jgi:hypothetical protein